MNEWQLSRLLDWRFTAEGDDARRVKPPWRRNDERRKPPIEATLTPIGGGWSERQVNQAVTRRRLSATTPPIAARAMAPGAGTAVTVAIPPTLTLDTGIMTGF